MSSTISKQINLAKLTLRNFKGIRDFVLTPNSGSTSVFGDNATGKTTLFDAFVWLLFDKDSQNKKDFEIKTLDPAGKPIHNLEHEVETVLQVNGRPKTLRKVFAEKWTKKRGSATAEFTGHETTYFIDGVPMKKSEYDDAVNAIVNEHIFKLLTNPMFFNEQLKWQERRKVLLEVCGDVSDAEVIGSNKALADLPAILGDRSIDDHRKVLASRRTKINEELEKIPIRIDEAERSKPDVSALGQQELTERISKLRSEIAEKEVELSRIQNGGEVTVKENRVRELEGELLQLKNELQAGTLDKSSAKRREIVTLQNEQAQLRRQLDEKERIIERNKATIAEQQSDVLRLRKQWNEVNEETFVQHHDDSCPACGQALPAEKLQAAHDKAIAEFNRTKSERLELISAKGKAAAGEVKRLQDENASHTHTIESLEQQIAVKEAELAAAEAALATLQTGVTDVETNSSYIAKQKEIEAIRKEITGLRSSMQGALDDARLELAHLRTELELMQKHKASWIQITAADERIAILKDQEKGLAAEYELLEQELFLTEEFIRTKVTMLESKINSKFKFARFKLFDQQINGGLSEVCETTYRGVPYSSSLNNGARINVGLDIINTLAEHYGVAAPIFVDNAESVTSLIETHGQQIRLVVSAMDKQLRVEDGAANMKEAV